MNINNYQINLENIKKGINFKNVNNSKLIIYKKDDNNYKCYNNICKHQGGTFLKSTDIEDLDKIVKCCRHGWKFDCENGNYLHSNNIQQEELDCEIKNDCIYISKKEYKNPWEVEIKEKQIIKDDEFVVSFLCHASLEIKCGNDIIFTDPWFEGPAFGRGWWNLYKVPEDAFERLSKSNIIYISHFHSDHLSYYTLKKLYNINPNINFVMAKLKQPIWRGGIGGNITEIGFKNIHIIDLNTWYTISKDTRLMILPDGINDVLDTCLLVEYKGNKILNLVDCCMPNNQILPKDIEVIFSDFAGGSSGYPACFYEIYGKEKTYEISKKNAKLFLNKINDCLKLTNCKMWVPIAGYFTEIHPSDSIIKELNYHNSPYEATEIIKKNNTSIKTWIPFPNGNLDIKKLSGSQTDNLEIYYQDYINFDFNKYNDYYKNYNYNKELDVYDLKNKYYIGIKKYFEWANFMNYDLILHIVETDEDFNIILKEYYIDLLDLSFIENKKENRDYYRIKVRQDMMRYIMTSGNSWELLSIGFSGRFFSIPENLYPYDFKTHFDLKLPIDSSTLRNN